MSFRDEKGRLLPGHQFLGNQATQSTQDQQDTSPEPDALPSLDSSFDDDLIAAAESYGKPRAKTGRRAWCESLRDQRPVDFAALLRPALARRAEAAQAIATGTSGVKVFHIGMIPSNHFVTAEQMAVIQTADLGGYPSVEPPQPPPRTQPVLVSPPADDDDQPPYTMDEVNRMTKEQFDASIAAGEILIIDKQR